MLSVPLPATRPCRSEAGLKAIYLSDWQVAADAHNAGQMYPDQSLYPADNVSNAIRGINTLLVPSKASFFIAGLRVPTAQPSSKPPYKRSSLRLAPQRGCGTRADWRNTSQQARTPPRLPPVALPPLQC